MCDCGNKTGQVYYSIVLRVAACSWLSGDCRYRKGKIWFSLWLRGLSSLPCFYMYDLRGRVEINVEIYFKDDHLKQLTDLVVLYRITVNNTSTGRHSDD